MFRKKLNPARHRLLLYHRLGQRWRISPLLTAALGALLYLVSWLTYRGAIQIGNVDMLLIMYQNRMMFYGLIGFCLLLYIITIRISLTSYVEVRPKALRIRAGMTTQDISYGRVSKTRLVTITSEYPLDKMRRRDQALLEPLMGYSCSAIDLNSWPKQPIRRLWHKYMFTPKQSSLLFIVKDAMMLNQQIDTAVNRRRERISKPVEVYRDPMSEQD